jgi:tetratricopeptide (TPR) repeat protein
MKIKKRMKQAEEFFYIANTFASRGEYDKAVKAYHKSIELNPNHTAYNNLGIVYGLKGEYDKAIKAYMRTLDMNPNFVESYYNLGHVYFEKGEYEKAIQTYSKAVELNPNNATPYVNIGKVYYKQDNYLKTIEAYSKAVKFNPKDAMSYCILGSSYHNIGEYDKAVESYKKAIELNPSDPDGYNNIGNIYYHKGEYDNALAAYKKGLELQPDSVYVYNGLGTVYSSRGEYGKAIEAYNKAIELDPNYLDVYSNLGIAYYDRGEYDKVIEIYTRLLEISPDFLRILENLGNVYYETGEYGKAIDLYNRAIELKPDNISAYSNLGIIYKAMGEHDKSIEAYNKVRELNPHSPEAYFILGNAYAGSKKQDEAIESYKKAIELKPDYSEAYCNLGNVYRQRNEYDKAKFYYNYFYFCLTMEKYNTNISSVAEKYNVYKQIYIISFKIRQLLHVCHEEETEYGLAHYTHTVAAEELLIQHDKMSSLKLKTALLSDDPTEGTVIFDYFGLKNQAAKVRDNQAFFASFTFDPESPNLFSLYSKASKQEVSGVSLIIKNDFFAEKTTAWNPESVVIKQEDGDETVEKPETADLKYPLYRCIYIDPETKQIIALSHKDDYTFFRNQPPADGKTVQKKIRQYKEKINRDLKKVQKEFDRLKKIIDTTVDLEERLVCDMLINLRYLVKHVAFKDEQECRIVEVEYLNNHDRVQLKNGEMFIETCPPAKFVDKVCFAPHTDAKLFQEKLVYEDLKNVTCYQCNHPVRKP